MKLQNLIHILIGIPLRRPLADNAAVSPPPDGGYPGGNTHPFPSKKAASRESNDKTGQCLTLRSDFRL